MDKEREARRTAINAAAGVAAGSIAGLSGAGITSGFGKIGGTVGESTFSGIAISDPPPFSPFLALTVAYKLWKWISD